METKMRLIDVDKLKEYIDDCVCCEKCDKIGFMCNDDCELPDCVTPQWERVLNEQPTVDAKPVRHGRWVRDEFGAKCCACGLYAYRDKFDQPWESPYCPNCGAKMYREQEAQNGR